MLSRLTPQNSLSPLGLRVLDRLRCKVIPEGARVVANRFSLCRVHGQGKSFSEKSENDFNREHKQREASIPLIIII